MVFDKFAREFVIASKHNDEFFTPFAYFTHALKNLYQQTNSHKKNFKPSYPHSCKFSPKSSFRIVGLLLCRYNAQKAP